VQIAPVVEVRTRAKKGEARKTKALPQNAHRLAIIAYKSEEEIARLIAGEHASHLCHQPTCINGDHLVVEPKSANEGRKECRALGPIIKVTIGGVEYTLPPNGACGCEGKKCIFMIERRSALPAMPASV
jgi:hypothetical protein